MEVMAKMESRNKMGPSTLTDPSAGHARTTTINIAKPFPSAALAPPCTALPRPLASPRLRPKLCGAERRESRASGTPLLLAAAAGWRRGVPSVARQLYKRRRRPNDRWRVSGRFESAVTMLSACPLALANTSASLCLARWLTVADGQGDEGCGVWTGKDPSSSRNKDEGKSGLATRLRQTSRRVLLSAREAAKGRARNAHNTPGTDDGDMAIS